MWPWKDDRQPALTSQAIAHLKADLSRHGVRDTIELPPEKDPVMRPLGNGLAVLYVIDQPDALVYINHADLARDGITAAGLHTIGIANLERRARVAPLRVHPYQSVFAVTMGGYFEADVLLLDTVWEHGFRSFVTGDYLAAIPTRDVLAFCDASSVAGRNELLEVIRKFENSRDHPLSQSLYLRVGNAWVEQ